MSMASGYGKGDRQRPTNKRKFDENYDRIFSSKKTHGQDTQTQDASGQNKV